MPQRRGDAENAQRKRIDGYGYARSGLKSGLELRRALPQFRRVVPLRLRVSAASVRIDDARKLRRGRPDLRWRDALRSIKMPCDGVGMTSERAGIDSRPRRD